MHRTENFTKIAKIFILAFLCSEMQSNFTQQHTMHGLGTEAFVSWNNTKATPVNSKHQASIRLASQDKVFGDGHLCSGAVVAPSVVLTTAECVYNYSEKMPRHPSELKVVMGTLSRYQSTSQTLSYGVTHIYQPPTFSAQTLRDNIAIIMLERDIPAAQAAVQPISLLDTTCEEDTAFQVTTWGSTPKHVPIAELLMLNSTKVRAHHCLEKFNRVYTPSSDSFCTEFDSEDRKTSQKDIGAPVLFRNQLLGLVSLSADRASVFVVTDVRPHRQWILSKIGDGSNQNSSVWGSLGLLLFTAYALKTANIVKI